MRFDGSLAARRPRGAVPLSVGWCSYAPAMSTDPSREEDDVATEAIDEIGEVIEDLADDVSEFVGRIRDDLLGREGYLIVLVMTILVVVLIPIDAAFRGGGVVTVAAIGLLVFTTMSRSKVSHGLRLASAALIGIAFVLAIVLTATDDTAEARKFTWLAATFAASYSIMITLCFMAVLRHAFTRRRISLNTVAAALAAYLMIGLIFTSAFRFVEIVAGPFFTQTNVNSFSFEYFSFITLSTVGYGDFTPANDAGRTLAMLEGVFGQIFLVTIVALVVSNLGVERHALRHTMTEVRRPPGEPSEGPPDGPDTAPPDQEPTDP